MPADRPAAADQADLDLLLAAGREAAALALTHFEKGARQWIKANGTPVSEADIAVGELLKTRLRQARPDYGWLSEEDEDSPERLGRTSTFIIDPIDGTREFLAGRPEWTISVAVVREGRPAVGLLAAPSLGETYWALRSGGAFRDGVRLAASGAASLVGARLAGPRRLLRSVAERAGAAAADIRFVGSLAYRLSLIALDRAEVAVGAEGSREWDLAAADILLRESGAALTSLSGDSIRYNVADTMQPLVMAAAPRLQAVARELVHAAIIAGSATPPSTHADDPGPRPAAPIDPVVGGGDG